MAQKLDSQADPQPLTSSFILLNLGDLIYKMEKKKMVMQMLFPFMDEESEGLSQEAAPSRGLSPL